MMKKDNSIPKHHSLRLKGHDYSHAGLYFITICTKDRQHYFGKISGGEMTLNETGAQAELFLMEIANHFNHARVTEHVIMPNHVHLILKLSDFKTESGNNRLKAQIDDHDLSADYADGNSPIVPTTDTNIFGKPVCGSVSVIINQYKASVKRWCNAHGIEYFHWQNRFHDHIIRNQESCNTIANYIRNNPKQWEKDKFYLK